MFLGAPTLRLRGDYLAIVTLGFGEIIRITARNLDNVTNGAAGITQVPVPPARRSTVVRSSTPSTPSAGTGWPSPS